MYEKLFTFQTSASSFIVFILDKRVSNKATVCRSKDLPPKTTNNSLLNGNNYKFGFYKQLTENTKGN